MTLDGQAFSTVAAFFRAIEAVDPRGIASLFAEDAELEDPVGAVVIRGRANIEASFANGLAQSIQSAKITTVFAAPSGGRVAAHWTMTARTLDGREVLAEGIDVITVDDRGLIGRVEGYWDAAAFAARLGK